MVITATANNCLLPMVGRQCDRDLKVNLQVIVRRSRLFNNRGLGKGNSGHNIGFAAPVKGRVGDTGRRAFDLPPFLVFRFVFLHKFFDFVG